MKTENITSVVFQENELELLNNGLNYNFHCKQKAWIKTPALDADITVSNFNVKEQTCVKQVVAEHIPGLIKEASMTPHHKLK